ncbi:titin homolog isoform X1 [Ptychodera flava]|uniref:titin homolog isoform X1 n=1 Tax=Ptychodera flava TaxID=63121 RepID=UPI00396A8FD1
MGSQQETEHQSLTDSISEELSGIISNCQRLQRADLKDVMLQSFKLFQKTLKVIKTLEVSNHDLQNRLDSLPRKKSRRGKKGDSGKKRGNGGNGTVADLECKAADVMSDSVSSEKMDTEVVRLDENKSESEVVSESTENEPDRADDVKRSKPKVQKLKIKLKMFPQHGKVSHQKAAKRLDDIEVTLAAGGDTEQACTDMEDESCERVGDEICTVAEDDSLAVVEDESGAATAGVNDTAAADKNGAAVEDKIQIDAENDDSKDSEDVILVPDESMVSESTDISKEHKDDVTCSDSDGESSESSSVVVKRKLDFESSERPQKIAKYVSCLDVKYICSNYKKIKKGLQNGLRHFCIFTKSPKEKDEVLKLTALFHLTVRIIPSKIVSGTKSLILYKTSRTVIPTLEDLEQFIHRLEKQDESIESMTPDMSTSTCSSHDDGFETAISSPDNSVLSPLLSESQSSSDNP